MSPVLPIPSSMRAIIRDRYGGPEVLRHERVPVPEPAADEILVRVHAAGVDRGVEHMMTGTPPAMRLVTGLRRPKRSGLGLDVAGTVVRLGAEVSGFAVDDEVFGIAPGAWAEFAAGKAAKLAPKPAALSFEHAAIVPVSGGTALQALVDVGKVQAGQSVLVLGASGGVGTYAVQLAKALRAEVTGVCSPGKTDLVRSLGADHVLDHTAEDFADGTRRYDLILDIGGSPSLPRLRRALAPRGTAVFVGSESGGPTGMGRAARGASLSPFLRQRLSMLVAKERASDLVTLAELIEKGSLTPVLDRAFPLAEAGDALRLLSSGAVRGKVALTVRSGTDLP
jgi:NADPH:quinone reductase-like Zn-dependent oxidoreductase